MVAGTRSGPITKGHLRSLMHKLFDLSMLWEYLPLERRNPIEVVRIRNVTKRQKKAVVLTPEQFREVIRRLPAQVNMVAITITCLGLRVSEALGFQWQDIDWQGSPSGAAPIAGQSTRRRPYPPRPSCL